MLCEASADILPLAPVERPVGLRAVHELLDLGRRRRVTVVIGAAGWGKTTAVASWASRTTTAWLRPGSDGPQSAHRFLQCVVEILEPHTVGGPPSLPEPEDPAVHTVTTICNWLRASLRDDLMLVLDDVQDCASDVARAVDELCRHSPNRLHIVLVSRCELPFSMERLRGQGLVAEVSAADLALDLADVATLLRTALGEAPDGLAAVVYERTGGWPAAVSAAVDALRGVDPDRCLGVVEQLSQPGERLHGYLDAEVIGREPAPVRELLRRLAVFGEARSASVVAPGVEGAERLLVELTRRGLVRCDSGDSVRWSVSQPLQDYFDHETVLCADDRSALHHIAAREALAHEVPGEALGHLVAAGDHAACAALLLDHGGALVSSGQAGAVLEAAALLGPYSDDPRIQQVIGDARQVRGQWAPALECFRRAGHDRERLEPALAWRVAQLAFSQGELAEVQRLYARTRFIGEDTADEARMLALTAMAARVAGDVDGLRDVAARALRAAHRSGEPSAWAAVHNLLSMVADAKGDRRRADAHHADALHSAEAADDLLQLASIRLSHATQLLELGLPQPALTEAQAALQLGERCGNPFLTAQALTTRGRAKARLGALQSAVPDYTRAVELFQRIGSRFLAWPLCGLGDVHRTRGQLAQARAAYEEALALAEPCHDVLGLGSALVGLARVRAADDLTKARALADRAVALGEGLREIPAHLARGWVALLAGDRQGATADAARAGAAARRRRDRPGLAEAIELGVLAAPHPEADAGRLDEAIDIWHQTGCAVEEAAGRVVAARLGARADHLGAELAHETLRKRGIDVGSHSSAGPLAVVRRTAPLVSIRTLGVFQVMHNGVPVAKVMWQSRKARDLLKLLVTRRRPVPRDELMELLWPGVDPSRSGNRLSVLLSTVRDVLGPARSGDGPLVTEGSAVQLDHAQVEIDVETFLDRAAGALDAHRRGDPDALARLTAAEAAHTGDYLADDPYLDWVEPLAEEVKATYIGLLRALIGRLRGAPDADDVDEVVRYTLRLLGQDGYDEQAHLDLVEVLLDARRFGAARRRYQIYLRRMKEIGVEPRPMPRVLRAAGREWSHGPAAN